MLDVAALIEEVLAPGETRFLAAATQRAGPGRCAGAGEAHAPEARAPRGAPATSGSAPSTSRSCLAGETYAVPIALIAEILKPPPITEVPRAPRNVIGVISVRGQARDRHRSAPPLPPRPRRPLDRQTRILLVDVGAASTIGLLVDEVLQV